MRVGFDCDGVISHTPLRRILSFVGKPLGRAYRHIVSSVRPNWWAIQLIHELEAEGHEVVIITGTPKMFQPERSAWMERHGIGQLAVYYNPKSDFSTKQQINHKTKTIRRLGVKVYVEDQPRVAKGIAQLAKVEVVLHVGRPKETAREVREAIRDATRKRNTTRRGAELNGAAPSRARKVSEPYGQSVVSSSFNGAAPPRGIHTTLPSVINLSTPPPKEYVTREGHTSLGEVKVGDLLEVYYPATGRFFKAKVLSAPMAKGGIWYIEIQDKTGEKQGAVWHGSYFVLGEVGVENPRPQIVISVPHAIGMPATGRMKGHDYIAEEMARKLAERLSAHPLYLVVGDIPRDVMDLNRERARWKTHFRQMVREAIKRDPQNTIHLDVHSFRINSKVYAGNDIAIVTTEKRARPHETALRDLLVANGVRCRIYTEMLMDVVPEGRELGVAVSYLIEFNEGSTPEQKDRYADLVADFILRAASSWPPEWPSVAPEAGAVRVTEPQANPDGYPEECLRRLFTRRTIMELHYEAAQHGVTTGVGLRRVNRIVFEDMLEDVERLIQQRKRPCQIASFIAKVIIPKGGIEKRPRLFEDANHRTTWLIIRTIYRCFGLNVRPPLKEDWEMLDRIDRMTEREIQNWLDSHFPLEPSLTSSGLSSATISRNVLRNQRSHSSSLIANNYIPPAINSLPAEANPAALRESTPSETAHEERRISEMSVSQLRTRLGRMTIPQKIYAFAVALTESHIGSVAEEAFEKLRTLGYDREGFRIKPRRPRRTPATPRLPQRPIPASHAVLHWNELRPNDLVRAVSYPDQEYGVVVHVGSLDAAGADEHSVWALWEAREVSAVNRWTIATETELLPGTQHGGELTHYDGIHENGEPADFEVIVRDLRGGARRPALVPWSGLNVGDLVEIPAEMSRSADRFTVVHHLGIFHEGDELHGESNSVWGLWERTPELAERKYLRAVESDLHPFLPGLLKHNSDTEAIYKILRSGILRPSDNRTKIEMLEGKGVPVRDGEAEMYYAVPSGMTPPYTTLQPNFEYSEGEVILVSTHPEVGLQLGEGMVVPLKVPVAHLSFLREYPHRADFQLGAPEESWPMEPTDFLDAPFNVRSVGLVRGNPECVLCSNLQTPKVYYEDPFIIICDDIKHDHSILAMIKRHAEKPEEWERKWLMRVLNYIAGEAFHKEFEIEQTMNTVPTHYHVHASGENPLQKERSALEIIGSVQEIAHR
jgi:hypothetical protein